VALTVISLGWGVQSWGLAAMSALGKLPPVDVALHADTGWERSETYAFARKWTPWLEQHGVRVVTVSGHNPIVNKTKAIMPPVFTHNIKDHTDGIMPRQCTSDWKIAPMRRWLSTQLDNKHPGAVEQWIGITLEESHRAKQADVQYIVHRHPLLEMLERPHTRRMIIEWLHSERLPVPVKSSCVFCPYHDDLTWRRIKQADNGDWERAVEVDRAIRDKRPGYKCYLHSSRQPLEDVRLGIEQLEMW